MRAVPARSLALAAPVRARAASATAPPRAPAPVPPGRGRGMAGGGVACRASGGVEKPDVEALANMAQISITPEEVKDWGPKIEGIVDWFGKLAEIDVEGVEPSLRAGEDENRFREDTAVPYEARGEIMEAVPEAEGVYLKVPKIMGESAD